MVFGKMRSCLSMEDFTRELGNFTRELGNFTVELRNYARELGAATNDRRYRLRR